MLSWSRAAPPAARAPARRARAGRQLEGRRATAAPAIASDPAALADHGPQGHPSVSERSRADLTPCAGDDYPVDTASGDLTGGDGPDLVVNVMTCGDGLGVASYVYRRIDGKYQNVFADERPPVYGSVDDGGLVVIHQVYKKDDPVSYPSGEEVITYGWRDDRFIQVARVYTDFDANTPSMSPEPTSTTRAAAQGAPLDPEMLSGASRLHPVPTTSPTGSSASPTSSTTAPSSERKCAMAETHVLFVEDDDVIREATQLALERDGFVVTAMPDGLSGLEAFRDRPPDIALLDVMVPGLDGVSLCRRIRDESTVPVIMLSARADSIDVVLGLEAGRRRLRHQAVRRRGAGRPHPRRAAPLRPRERPRAAGRGRPRPDGGVLVFGDLEIDTEGMEVRRAGERWRLTPTEMRLLLEFSAAPGHGALPRQAAGAGLGLRLGRRHPGRGRPCAAAAHEDRPGPDRDGPRLRLQAEGHEAAVALRTGVPLEAQRRHRRGRRAGRPGAEPGRAQRGPGLDAGQRARRRRTNGVQFAQRHLRVATGSSLPFGAKIDDPTLPAELRGSTRQGPARHLRAATAATACPTSGPAVPLADGHVLSLHTASPTAAPTSWSTSTGRWSSARSRWSSAAARSAC